MPPSWPMPLPARVHETPEPAALLCPECGGVLPDWPAGRRRIQRLGGQARRLPIDLGNGIASEMDRA